MAGSALLLSFSTLVAAIFLSNLLVIMLYIKVRRLRTLSNRLAVSSALCCIFISIVFIPVNVFEEIGYGQSVPWQQAVRGHATAFETMLLLLSTAALSYDRYISILYGMRYSQCVTTKKIRKTLLVVWLSPLIMSLFPLMWSIPVPDEQIVLLLFNVYQGLMSSLIFLILMGIIILYLRIYFQQSRHWEEDNKFKALQRRFSTKRQSSSSGSASVVTTSPIRVRYPYCASALTRCQKCLKNTSLSCTSKCSECSKDVDDVTDISAALFLTTYQITRVVQRCSIRASERRAVRLKKMASKLHSMRLFIVIFSITTLCWMPIIIINLLEAFRLGELVPASFIVISKFAFLANCIINPFVYNLCTKESRRGLRSLIDRKRHRSSTKQTMIENNSESSWKQRHHLLEDV